MEHEPGDEYLRKVAGFIRKHEQSLAEGGFGLRRRIQPRQPDAAFSLNPLAWVSTAPEIKPIVFKIDPHHLFYILMRIEAVGIDVGPLDVRLDSPSRPTTYINFAPKDNSDALSLSSIRSSLSTMSNLSLTSGWWSKPAPPSLDLELKYIYSSFTKLPALTIHGPSPKMISELANDPPSDTAIPLDSFKNLQGLDCSDVDPRMLLGWDRVAESVRSLTIKRSGLEDVTNIFVDLVLDDQSRREGNVTQRRKRFSGGPSRQASFHGTGLPETVTEDAEETPVAENSQDVRKLSSLKWAFLRHLCLAENSLAFFSAAPLHYLTSLTHLDLSSNLLVSVPSGLSTLFNLVSLNLSDNMIDSVLGIYQRMGQVLYLNLSRNRLESICGLERLPGLERVDLRHNIIEESSEVGRLATLPNIREVWVDGNPLVELEEAHRVKCFEYFHKEGKEISLDGATPTFYEKRYLPELSVQHPVATRPVSAPRSPPVVAVGGKAKAAEDVHSPSPGSSSPASRATSPLVAAVHRPKKRKTQRIVDLDGNLEVVEGMQMPGPSVPPLKVNTAKSIDSPPVTEAPRPKRGSRHSRHQTEGGDYLDNIPPIPTTGSLRASRAAARRSRASASVYEPPRSLGIDDQQKEAQAFRARIEALKSDMGDGWLKVLNQSQIGTPGVTSS